MDCVSELGAQVDEILPEVQKPSQYMGREYGAVQGRWEDSETRVALAYPDSYGVGMSHLGLQILYRVINGHEEFRAERVFAPLTDMAEKLRSRNLPLFSLESRKPVSEFDFLGITLQSELTYTNVLQLLSLSHIPLRRQSRALSDPFVVVGGPCAFNAEPLAPFADLVALGDGEELIMELLNCFRRWIKERRPGGKEEFYCRAAQIEGIYAPALYDPEYDESGNFSSISCEKGVPSRVKKRVLEDLNRGEFPVRPVIPYADTVHDRGVVELFRGCTRGCRFCLPGMVYRPVRERSADNVCDITRQLVLETGYEEVSLSSLSSTDYSSIGSVVDQLVDTMPLRATSLSLPSLRVDAVSVDVADKVREVRNTGLTVAPEAGSQRLRDVINKGVTQEDFEDALQRAFSAGCDNLKLYFMMGLPTETDADIIAQAEMVDMARRLYSHHRKSQRGLRISVSVALFVPKPHTPFQWEPQLGAEEFQRRVELLRGHLPSGNVKVTWSDPQSALIEAALARGDRRLADVIQSAWEKGAVFDGWSEHFSFQAWREAFDEEDLDPWYYASRTRGENEPFPWEHLDPGVTREFLLSERRRAFKGIPTPDCRWADCSGCGMSCGVTGEHGRVQSSGDEHVP